MAAQVLQNICRHGEAVRHSAKASELLATGNTAERQALEHRHPAQLPCTAHAAAQLPGNSQPTGTLTFAARTTRREQPFPALRHPGWHLSHAALFLPQLPGAQPAAHRKHFPVAGSTPPVEQ